MANGSCIQPSGYARNVFEEHVFFRIVPCEYLARHDQIRIGSHTALLGELFRMAPIKS